MKRAPISTHPERVAVVLVCLIAALVGYLTLSHESYRLTSTNNVRSDYKVATVDATHREMCVDNQRIPADTGGVQLHAVSADGRPVRLSLNALDADGRQISRAVSVTGAKPGLVTFALAGLGGQLDNVTLCVEASGKTVSFGGQPSGEIVPATAKVDGVRAGGDIRVQYVRAEPRSWISQFPEIARRASLYRPSWYEAWTLYAVIGLALALIALAVWALLTRIGRWRRRGWLVFVVAMALFNALAWSLTTPSFQAPDEISHYAYVETLAERGMPGTSDDNGARAFSPALLQVLQTLVFRTTNNDQSKSQWSRADEAEFMRHLERLDARGDPATATTAAASYSPLYYGPAAVAYKVSGGTVFDRLWAVRLFSALLIAGGAAFAFLAAREVAPGVDWFAPVAGSVVVLHPMYAHIGSGVQNDSLIMGIASLIVYLVARAFRRGLTPALAAAIGVAAVLGYVAKPALAGFAPAVVLAIVLLAMSDRSKARANRRLVLASFVAATALSAVVSYALFGATGGDTATSLVDGNNAQPFSVSAAASYLWQFFLPPMPWMHDFFGTAAPPVYIVLFRGFMGVFNHLDTSYPLWAYKAMFALVACLAALAIRLAYVERARWREWMPLASTLASMVAGMMMLIAVTDYLVVISGSPGFAQGRYMLPCIAIFGIFVATAARGAGLRWAPAVGVGTVTTLAFYNLLSIGLTLSRFYV